MKLTEDQLKNLPELVNNETLTVKYLGIDPGNSNGCCGYDERYRLMFMFTVPADLMIKFLHSFKHVEACVLENFTLFPHKRTEQNYSDMLTSRVIGRVEDWAELNNIQLIKQGPNIKKTGYLWLGQKSPSKSNPANHELDAHCHFTYWAVKNGKIKAEDLIRNDPNDGRYLIHK